MPDYQNGKIYTIRYKLDISLIYVGSTTQSLCNRWSGHKNFILKDKSSSTMYQKIKETDDIDNWYIELYELYPCNSKEELNKREGEITRNIGTLNEKIAGRTKAEYDIDNKTTLQEKYKEYYQENKDKWVESGKVRRENGKKSESDKKYRETHREYLHDRKTELITCECGGKCQRDNLARHRRGKQHLDYMELNH